MHPVSLQPLSDEVIDALLSEVDKPARYTGGELNSIVKTAPVRARLALGFPDIYEVAESHIGLKILYDIINKRPDLAAERVYALWPDLEQKARVQGVPLWSLETRRPLAAFDVVGFTLQYELSYPTLLGMLDHGGVTLRAEQRGEHEPFVIGGGAGAMNPEPIAAFFDAFLLGDGEEAIVEIMDAVASGRERQASRAELLLELGRIAGVYVPSFYEITYDGLHVKDICVKPGAPIHTTHAKHGTPRVVRRTIVDLDSAPYPTKQIVPNVQPVHDRVAIEIQRGCSQACRFCQAGMITRPTRQRRPETVLRLADEALKATGSDSVGLLSLSAGDYEPINEVLAEFFKRYKDDRISVGMPSMRTETMTPELAAQVATVKKSGWTFAPEAGSERMRKVINKTNSEADLMNAVRATVSAGWRQLKFYFMMGLPTETLADIDAIAHTGERARAEGRKIRQDVDVVVSVSTFVPKPHTSFQWERQIGIDETYALHARLRGRLESKRIRFRWHDPEQSFLEGVLSRGDRRLADALEAAALAGCRLDAWTEHYDHGRWMNILATTLAPHGLSAADYLSERDTTKLLPWDHLDAGILKKFLLRDRKKAYAEGTIEDCAFAEHCYACGGCDLGDPYLPRGSDGTREVTLAPVVHKRITDPDSIARVPSREGPVTATQATHRSRLRFRFSRTGRAVHLGQLDTTHQLLRAVRQAELPVLYSEGHTPRPRVGFSPACPTGIESMAEFMDVECAGHPDGRTYAEKLRAVLPDGINIIDVEELSWRAPSFTDVLLTATYTITPRGIDEAVLRAKIAAFTDKAVMPIRVLRKDRSKIIDARRLVAEVAVVAGKMQLTIAFAEDGSIKIGEAIAAVLGPELLPACRIRKEHVVLADSPRDKTPSPRVEATPDTLDLTTISDRRKTQHSSERPKVSAGTVVPYAE
jgi:radical SAM family uncharacterized protein/radical SAM-linked protein